MSDKITKWYVFSASFFGVFAFLFALQACPPVLVFIMTEFNTSYAAASTLMSFVALPAILISIPGAFLVSRYGFRKMGSLALILVAIGSLIVYFSNSLLLADIGRLIVGIGGSIMIVTAPSILPSFFSIEELGLIMGIYSTNMPVATVIAFNTLGLLGQAYGWRYAFLIASVISLLALVYYSVVIREPATKGRANFSTERIKHPQIWIIGLIWALFNMAAIAYTTWSSSFFVEFRNIAKPEADFLASMLMLAAIPMVFVSGYISDRLGKRKPLIVISLVVMIVALLWIPSATGILLYSAIALLGVAAAVLAPPLFALPAEIVGKRVEVAFGVLNTCLNIGITLGPLIVGIVRDALQSEFLCYVTMASFTLVALMLTFLLKTR